MQILKKSILLSFVLQASFVPNIGARRLSGKSGKSDKSSKSAKHPKSVCLERGFKIEPDFEGIASPETFYLDCCQGWTGYDQTTPWTGTAATDLAALIGCSDELAESENFQECSEKYLVTYPFGHAAYGYDYEFEFATISDAPLGETAFRGEIGVDSGEEKVILSYLSEPYDSTEFNGNLLGRELASLEYIEYSFKASSCHGAVTECPGQFYMNVYTKDPNDTTDPYYNCRFDFVPVEGADSNTGEWETVRFSATDTVPNRVECQGDSCTTTCPRCGFTGTLDCDDDDKMGALALDGVLVLGSNANQIFTLNMGDGNPDDGGLEGYFDRIVVKISHEDSPRVYDL